MFNIDQILVSLIFLIISCLLQEVFRLGQNKGLSLSHLSSQDIENKLSETLNGEVIEPVLRVWRGYRFAVKNTQCDKYIICELNRHDPRSEGPSGLKPGITKLARYS